jgi:hypothetical protein
MKASALAFLFALGASVTTALAAKQPDPAALRDGDIIFQTSRSGQSKAIQMATHSPYSHCGIVYFRDGKAFVYEASTEVKESPLARFIKKGEGGKCVIKRLKKADSLLTPDNLAKLKAAGKAFDAKPYDSWFGWADDRIYCSELVYKIYKNALGLEIGATARLRDFDLTHPETKRVMGIRYGDKIPMDEVVISPAAQFADTALATVFDSY